VTAVNKNIEEKNVSTRRIVSAISVILVFVLCACNLNIQQQSGPDLNAQAATIVALTLQVANNGQNGQAPLNTPTAISIVTKTGDGPATLAVTENTNCRSGPGTNYAKVTVIPANTTVEIVSRYSSGYYWIVKAPDGSGQCWVLGELGTVSGNVAALPEVTPEAGQDTGAPDKPSIQKYNFFCNSATGNTDVSIAWSDKADNESGYRVYRNGNVVAELPIDSTKFAETITLLAGQSAGYTIEAFNQFGATSSSVITISC
jgi:hypothetical protein